MFTIIGKYTAWWVRFPFIKRLAKDNPSDLGKLLVFLQVGGIVTSLASKWAMAHSGDIAEWIAVNITKVDPFKPTVADVVPFEARFGTVNPGDDMIFKQGGFHLEGRVMNVVRDKFIVKVPGDDTYQVTKEEVLDIIPAF